MSLREEDTPRAIVVAGQAPGLAVIRSLGRRHIDVALASYSPHDPARRSRYTNEILDVPDPLVDEAAFIQSMMSLEHGWTGSVVIPTCDQSVVAVARHRRTLGNIFRVASPDWAAVDCFIDKQYTYDLAEKIGVAVPKTVVPRSRALAEEALSRFSMPVLIKPSQGHLFARVFQTKMFECGDRQAAIEAYDRCVALGLQVMMQEIVPGPPQLGVNHIVLAREGEVVAEFTAQKIRNWPAEYGSPSAVRSKWVPDVAASTRALLKAKNYSGVACAEYKLDSADGRYKLMEVNARHNLSGALAPRCGVDFPWLHYRMAVGVDVEPRSAFREGVYWVDTVRDLRHLLREPWRYARALPSFLKPYLNRGVDARGMWSDPLPLADAVLRRLERSAPLRGVVRAAAFLSGRSPVRARRDRPVRSPDPRKG